MLKRFDRNNIEQDTLAFFCDQVLGEEQIQNMLAFGCID
jgi:hypothetical protein